MSQYFYEFNISTGTLYYPIPMLVKAHRRKMDLFVFEFVDAVFSVQGPEEKLNQLDQAMRTKGYIPDAMNAQMVEKSTIENS